MQTQPSIIIVLIEGFCAKRAYIGFWADFQFLQDRANFIIVLVDLHFVLQKYM